MTTGNQKRTRSERVASLAMPPGQWERAWSNLSRRDMLVRIGLTLLAAVAMVIVIRGWNPPFSYRTGYVPQRDIVARVSFTQADQVATEAARQRARSQACYVYTHDPAPLVQLRASLHNAVVELTSAEKLDDLDRQLLSDFQFTAAADSHQPSKAEQEEQFQKFRTAFTGKENPEKFAGAIAAAFTPFEEHGLLEKLPTTPSEGNQEKILVGSNVPHEPPQVVKVSDVLIGDGTALRESLLKQLEAAELPNAADLADRLQAWIRPRLSPTLQLDDAGTKHAKDDAAASVETELVSYKPGELLAEAGKPLDAQEMERLRLEYCAMLAQRPLGVKFVRASAALMMIFGMFILCGVYMRYRQRGPLASTVRLTVILLLAVVTVSVARWASADAWRAEIIPPMLFGMTVAIVYRQELALLLSVVLALVLVIAISPGLQEFVLLIGVTTAANLNVGRIRSRCKLIYVGLFAAAVAVLLYVGLGLIDNQPLGSALLTDAARNGLWALAAGFLMTGLLPFVEHLFGVLTDLSLLELGDVAHPLLQELVRRAPSTYNHSITVGSIAEAAAESIHARGLLCRVGAYFHDIGKMLKPGYFIENQGQEANRHEDLAPAMSTLVIIAHVKDGADLARQHHLPQPIIDMINQHHGTTLVEFFYERAAEQKQSDPNGGEVDQSTYRYPGPKPQTKEAAVLMLADNVESASRTLIDPTPKRIESLVREVAERRLHGGQFDESGLTLRELRTIEKSMVMSLTSIYHGRIKYPDGKGEGRRGKGE